jgi:chromosomal replication initiator protein
VLTSTKGLRDIPDLDARIRSRLLGGLAVEIDPPDLELKLSIVRRTAAYYRGNIPEDVAFLIAGSPGGDCIRALEGRVVRPGACASQLGREIDMELAEIVFNR